MKVWEGKEKKSPGLRKKSVDGKSKKIPWPGEKKSHGLRKKKNVGGKSKKDPLARGKK